MPPQLTIEPRLPSMEKNLSGSLMVVPLLRLRVQEKLNHRNFAVCLTHMAFVWNSAMHIRSD